jgi:hypothetical protein
MAMPGFSAEISRMPRQKLKIVGTLLDKLAQSAIASDRVEPAQLICRQCVCHPVGPIAVCTQYCCWGSARFGPVGLRRCSLI